MGGLSTVDGLSKMLLESDLVDAQREYLEYYLRDRLTDLTEPGLPARVARTAAAAILGRAGGRATSLEKAAAARRNGRKGGRPKKFSQPEKRIPERNL